MTGERLIREQLWKKAECMAEPVKSGLLSLPDKIGATKRMIEDVLNEFDVTYNWSKHTSARVLSVEIWISNKRLTHTVSITDQDVNFALKRADLRQKLITINAPRKRIPLPINPAIPGVRLSTPVATNRTKLLASTAIASEPKVDLPSGAENPVPINQEPDVVETVEPNLEVDGQSPPASQEAASQEAKPVLPSKPPIEPAKIDSRLIYKTSLLKATEVLVIDIPKGLIVTENSVLIVPIHDPTLLTSMPKAQFQALFEVVQTEAPSVASPIVKPEQAAPIVKPAKTLEEILPVVEPSPAFIAPSKATPSPRQKSEAISELINSETRSIKGITPQIARHLAAIAYIQRRGKSPVTVRDLAPLLDERDYKQVSARMPKAIALNYAVLHDKDSRPLRYSITQSGFKILASLQSWPWQRENLPIPSWAQSLK